MNGFDSYGDPQSKVSNGRVFDPIKNLSLPLAYNNLLETFLTAGEIGEVFPYYTRQEITVQAGGTSNIIISIPEGDTAAVVYLLSMSVDTDSSDFFVTFQADNDPPLMTETPMSKDINVLGAFLPPAHVRGVYTFVNNDSIDITFTSDVQLVIMNSEFTRTFYEPLMKGQYSLLKDLAQKFSNLQGSGQS